MNSPFILFINPWIYDFAAYDLWLKPLGLLYLASMLRANGFGVHVIDCLDHNHPRMRERYGSKIPARKETGKGHFYSQPAPAPVALKGIITKRYKRYGVIPEVFEDLLSALPKPRLILITSMMTYWYPGVFEVISRVKSHYPDVPVILGGVYATICAEHARAFSGADLIVRGPVENEILRIIAAFTGELIPAAIQSTAYDALPRPAFDLLSSRSALPVLSARGCPYRCVYCGSSMLFDGFHRRSPSAVVDEIEYWALQEGTTDFAFYDDAFLFNAAVHAVPLLKELIKRKLNIRLHFPNGLHIRGITQEVADLLKAVGGRTIRLGFETADTERQKQTGGKVKTDEFIAAAEFLRAAGFTAAEAGAYLLAGLPLQKAREIEASIELVQDAGLTPLIAEYSPIPGTRLWKQAVAVSPFPIAKEPLFHNNSLLPCQWEKFTCDDLERLKRKARMRSDV